MASVREMLPNRVVLLGLAVASLGGVVAWARMVVPLQDEVAALHSSEPTVAQPAEADAVSRVAALQAEWEELGARLRRETAALRRLVPAQGEVAVLLDELSRLARSHRLEIVEIIPEPSTIDAQGRRRAYRVRLLGGYADLVDWLIALGGLPRLIIPAGVELRAHTEARAASGPASAAFAALSPPVAAPTLAALVQLETWTSFDAAADRSAPSVAAGRMPAAAALQLRAASRLHGDPFDSERTAAAAYVDPLTLELAGVIWSHLPHERLALLRRPDPRQAIVRTLAVGDRWGIARVHAIEPAAVVLEVIEGSRRSVHRLAWPRGS